MFVNITVGVTQDNQAAASQVSIAHLVTCDTLGLIMLRAIQLNHQSCLVAIEINDIAPDCFLSVYCKGNAPQEKVPQLTLLRGHFFSQFLRIWGELFVVLQHHLAYL